MGRSKQEKVSGDGDWIPSENINCNINTLQNTRNNNNEKKKIESATKEIICPLKLKLKEK